MSAFSPAARKEFDIGAAIDAGRWGGYQKLVLFLVGCAIVLDGFDNQSLGLAAPSIIREWGLTKQMFSPIPAISQFGMMFGAAFGGLIGDKLGRKTALIGSVILFGVLTGALAFANRLEELAALRFVANLGLGAAFPNAAALAAEFTPARHRSLGVTVGIVCVPLGGVIGGAVAGEILPTIGWRMLFAGAGAATVVVALLLVTLLPESVRFRLRRSGDDAKLRATLSRMGVRPEADAQLVDRADEAESGAPKPSLGALFARAYRRDTLALWAAFGGCLFAVYVAFSWLATVLADAGYGPAISSNGLTAFNLGGVVAALSGAWLIGKFGSRGPMVAMAIGGILGAALLIVTPLDPSQSPVRLIAVLAIEGAFVNGVQTTLYALAAMIYPTAIRARGVGSAASVGRIGAVASALGGGYILERPPAGLGAIGFHIMLLGAMAVTTIALLCIKRHTPKPTRAAAANGPE